MTALNYDGSNAAISQMYFRLTVMILAVVAIFSCLVSDSQLILNSTESSSSSSSSDYYNSDGDIATVVVAQDEAQAHALRQQQRHEQESLSSSSSSSSWRKNKKNDAAHVVVFDPHNVPQHDELTFSEEHLHVKAAATNQETESLGSGGKEESFLHGLLAKGGEKDGNDDNSNNAEQQQQQPAPPQSSDPFEALRNFADILGSGGPPTGVGKIPVFWHIPKAGGSTIKDVMGMCHHLILATNFGVTDGHDSDEQLAVVYPTIHKPGHHRTPFVNVDTTTVPGIERAVQLNFAELAHALPVGGVVTPHMYEANALFSSNHPGQLFAIFRHPIDRAISMFYYIQRAHWEPTFLPELTQWSLEQYAQSDRIENNWMTRMLSRQYGGALTDQHVELALAVLRQKFIVGLMSQMEESLERLEKFFGWTYKASPAWQEECRSHLLNGGGANSSPRSEPNPTPGSQVWNLMAEQNNYDLKLYSYIEQLFQEQAPFFAKVPADFRHLDSTCCECDPPTFPPEGYECPKKVID